MKKHNNIIEIIEKHLVPIVEDKVKDFDPHSFQTTSYEMRQELSEKIEKISEEEANNFVKSLPILFEEINIEEAKHKILRNIQNERIELTKKDHRAELLYQLIEEAEKVTPMISFVILYRLDLQYLPENMVKCAAIYKECQEYKGERRAERVADLYHEIAERLYDNYARILWELCRVIQRKTSIKSNNTFGSIINGLKQHLPLKYQPLVNFDVSWYRNAAAHKSRKYLPKNDELLLYNGKKNEHKIICINCLLDIGKADYNISGTILHKIIMMYLQKNFMIDSGIWEISISIVKNLLSKKISDEDFNQTEQKLGELFNGLKKYQFKRI